MNELYTSIQTDYNTSIVQQKEYLNHFSRMQKDAHKQLEDMFMFMWIVMNRKASMLVKKEEEENQLREVVVDHFRSIIEYKVKEIQIKVVLFLYDNE